MRKFSVIPWMLLISFLISLPALASDKEIAKSADKETAEVGDTITWTLVVSNTSNAGGGPFDTPNAVVNDLLPSNLSFVSATSTQGTCSYANQNVTCNLGTLAANATVTISIVTTAILAGEVTNFASVTSGSFDPVSSNNESGDTVVVTEPQADLAVEKGVVPSLVNEGDAVQFSIIVTNNGPDVATGVRVGDDLSAIFTSVAASASQGTCSVDSSSNVVLCEIGTLQSGSSATVTIDATASTEGTYTNTASTDGEVADPVSSNNTDTATVVVRKDEADVSITKTVDKATARSGQDLVYTLTVSNVGPKAAEGVRVVDTFPLGRDGAPGIEFVSASPEGDCSHSNGSVSCEAGTLAAGESKTYTLVTYVTNSSTLTNTATATSTSPSDPNAANNTASATTDARRGSTAGSNPDGGDSADPVSTLTGEFFFDEHPDVMIPRGALLSFERIYASFLTRDGMVPDHLGPNWTHNHNWSIDRTGDFAQIVSPRGRVWGFRNVEGQWRQIETSSLHQLAETSSGLVFVDLQAQTAKVFNSGRLVSSVENGFTTTYDWSGDQLVRLSDALGNRLDIAWSSGRVASVTSGAETAVFSYQNEALSGVQYPGALSIAYEYDAGTTDGLLTARRLSSGVARTQQAYDGEGRVATQTDAFGNVTSFSYGDSETTVTHPDGTVSRYVHDDKGRLTRLTLQDGTQSDISYDPDGRSEVQSARGTLQLQRDASTGLVTRVVEESGATTEITYTQTMMAGATVPRVASVTYPDGTTIGYTYDSEGRVTEYTSNRNPNVSYSFDANGLLQSMTHDPGGTTQFSWSSNGNLASVTDVLGNVTSYAHDAAGRRTQITESDGATLSYTYDDAGRLVTETDASGVSTTYGYDQDSNLTSTEDALGNTMTFAFDNMGRLTAVTDQEGYTTSSAYDVMGNLSRITDPDGGVTTFSYDPLGRISQMTRPDGLMINAQRNAAGAMTGATLPDGTRSHQLDARGRITSVTTPGGRTTSVTYDEADQIMAVTRPDGGSITLERDISGGISAISIPGGISTSYGYDQTGRVVRVTDPSGGQWDREYDAGGRLSGFTTPGGLTWGISINGRGHITSVQRPQGTITMEYDAAGRQQTVRYPDNLTINYTYDAAGRLTSANDIAFELDGRGDIVGVNGIVGTRGPGGRLESFAWENGELVNYQYDTAGRVTRISDWDDGFVAFTYNAEGRLASIARSNGVTTERTYDDDGQLLSIVEFSESGELAGARLTRDAQGNIADAARTLPVVIERIPRNHEATFDADGRNTAFQYDAGSRLISDDRRTYAWNGSDRLTQAGATTIAYDGLMTPTQIGMWTHTVSYLHDQPVPATMESEGGETWRVVYTPSGRPVYRIAASDSSRQFFHFDEMGHATIGTNDSGDAIAGWAFDPYGVLLGHSGGMQDMPFLFNGAYGVLSAGEEDLYLMGVRAYDGQTGRFISPEPVRDMMDPQALDPYTFAAQNPLRFVDPAGTTPEEAASGDSFWFNAGSLGTGLISAGSTFSDWATDGFGRSFFKGFLDDIRGTKPPGGLNKFYQGKTTQALNAARQSARVGNLRGANSAINAAKGFHAEAQAAANANKNIGRLGAAASFAGVGFAAYEAKGRFDRIDKEMDREFDLAARQLDFQIRKLGESLKRGSMTRERYQQLVNIALEANRSQIEAIEEGHYYDVLFEGTRFFIKGIETFVPNPTPISISDKFMELGGSLFGVKIPQ